MCQGVGQADRRRAAETRPGVFGGSEYECRRQIPRVYAVAVGRCSTEDAQTADSPDVDDHGVLRGVLLGPVRPSRGHRLAGVAGYVFRVQGLRLPLPPRGNVWRGLMKTHVWHGYDRSWVAESPEFIKDLTRQPVVPFQPSPAQQYHNPASRPSRFRIGILLAAGILLMCVVLAVIGYRGR